MWLINLDPTVGAEIKKTRPAIIVNDDAVGLLPLKVIVPLTDWKERYAVAPWLVRVEADQANGLDKASAADAFQVRSVAAQRFTRRLGRASEEIMDRITCPPSHATRRVDSGLGTRPATSWSPRQ